MKVLQIIWVLLTFNMTLLAQEHVDQQAQEKPKEIVFFSNNGCGKCETSQLYFDENKMPYTKLLVRENRPLMYEYIHSKTGGKNVAIGYPVIVYGDSVYFSIKNIKATLIEIKQLMIEDGAIEESDQ